MNQIPADPERGAPEIVVGGDEVTIDALMSVAFDRRPVRLCGCGRCHGWRGVPFRVAAAR